MGNHSYQASNIIGGVSTKEYALRLDSQASDQRNCMLSPRYGLCKRPGSKFLANVNHLMIPAGPDTWGDNKSDEFTMFTVYHDNEEFIVHLGQYGRMDIYNNKGEKMPIIYFPKSSAYGGGPGAVAHTERTFYDYFRGANAGGTNYSGANEDNISHTTIGNVTYINNAGMQPKMVPDRRWEGYLEHYFTTTNDNDESNTSVQKAVNEDAFTFWIRASSGMGDLGRETYSCGLTFRFPDNHSTNDNFIRTEVRANVVTGKTDDQAATSVWDTLMGSTTNVHRGYNFIATMLAYQLEKASWTYNSGTFTNLIENNRGEALDPTSPFFYGTGHGNGTTYGNQFWEDKNQGFGVLDGDLDCEDETRIKDTASTVITGRWRWGNINGNYPAYPLVNVFANDNENISVCWKEVVSVSDLPPRSWRDHTVTITGDDKSAGTFYMRFVSDDHPMLYWHESRNMVDDSQVDVAGAPLTTNTRMMWPTYHLPRNGHWQESVGTGVLTDIDATTMPHMLIYRPATTIDSVGGTNLSAATFIAVDGGASGVDTKWSYGGWGTGSPNNGSGVPPPGPPTLVFGDDRHKEIPSSVINKDHHYCWIVGGSPDTFYCDLDAGFALQDGEVQGSAHPFTVNDPIQFLMSPEKRPGNQNGGTSDGTDNGQARFHKDTYLKEDTTYYMRDISITPGNTGPYDADGNTYSSWLLGFSLSETVGGSAMNLASGNPSVPYVFVDYLKYKSLGWANRAAGDDTTNPGPSFLSEPIIDVAQFQDRLVLSTESSVNFSGVADHSNFFRTTVRDANDSDPFSIIPATDDGALIKHTVPYKDKLVVLTANSQHVVSGEGGAFAASTVQILPATSATADLFAEPAAVGDYLFIPYTNESGTGIWEFSRDRQALSSYSVRDITEHVPGYIPPGPYKIVGSTKHNMLFVLDNSIPEPSDRQNLYVYSWLDTPQGRTQSAWTRWQFNRQGASHYVIKNMTMGTDNLYLTTVTQQAPSTITTHHLEALDLELTSKETGLHGDLRDRFNNICLDRRTRHDAADSTNGGIIAVSYSSSTGDSTISLPWVVAGVMDNDIVVVRSGGAFHTKSGTDANGTLTVDANQTDIVVHDIDLRNATFYVGFRYDMRSTFAPFSPKIGDQFIRGRNIFVRGVRLTYSGCNRFTIDQTNGGTAYQQAFDAGIDTGTTAVSKAQSGELYLGIRQFMPDLSYDISNNSIWNSFFQGLLYDINAQEIKGEYTRGATGARR